MLQGINHISISGFGYGAVVGVLVSVSVGVIVGVSVSVGVGETVAVGVIVRVDVDVLVGVIVRVKVGVAEEGVRVLDGVPLGIGVRV